MSMRKVIGLLILAILLGCGICQAQVNIGYRSYYGTPVMWTYDYSSGMYNGYDMAQYANPWWMFWNPYYETSGSSFSMGRDAWNNGGWMSV
jgi:hypothetical protein